MSITCYQKPRNLLILFTFLLLLFPTSSFATIPVATETEVSETIDSVVNDASASTVAKDKKKDKIQLNQFFYFSLLMDLAAVALIIGFVYYPNYKRMDTTFTFIMFNVVIFLLTYVLNEVKISMGAAFGLFAVFSMLRYRTAGIGMKDMTYLFIFIAMGLVSAIQLEFYELVIILAVIFITTLLLDTRLIMKKENSNTLRYEKIEMIKPDKREALIEELRERTGLNIHRVIINEIDFLKDTAIVTYFYYDEK